MNQKLSWSTFIGGLATFLLSTGELLIVHHNWDEILSPMEIGHLLIIGGSFCVTIMGALGVQLRRDYNYGDRITDKKLSDIQSELNKMEPK